MTSTFVLQAGCSDAGARLPPGAATPAQVDRGLEAGPARTRVWPHLSSILGAGLLQLQAKPGLSSPEVHCRLGGPPSLAWGAPVFLLCRKSQFPPWGVNTWAPSTHARCSSTPPNSRGFCRQRGATLVSKANKLTSDTPAPPFSPHCSRLSSID